MTSPMKILRQDDMKFIYTEELYKRGIPHRYIPHHYPQASIGACVRGQHAMCVWGGPRQSPSPHTPNYYDAERNLIVENCRLECWGYSGCVVQCTPKLMLLC